MSELLKMYVQRVVRIPIYQLSKMNRNLLFTYFMTHFEHVSTYRIKYLNIFNKLNDEQKLKFLEKNPINTYFNTISDKALNDYFIEHKYDILNDDPHNIFYKYNGRSLKILLDILSNSIDEKELSNILFDIVLKVPNIPVVVFDYLATDIVKPSDYQDFNYRYENVEIIVKKINEIISSKNIK